MEGQAGRRCPGAASAAGGIREPADHARRALYGHAGTGGSARDQRGHLVPGRIEHRARRAISKAAASHDRRLAQALRPGRFPVLHRRSPGVQASQPGPGRRFLGRVAGSPGPHREERAPLLSRRHHRHRRCRQHSSGRQEGGRRAARPLCSGRALWPQGALERPHPGPSRATGRCPETALRPCRRRACGEGGDARRVLCRRRRPQVALG